MIAQLELYQQQYDFVMGDSRRAAFVGGIGSGKTFAGCIRSLWMAGGADGLTSVPNLGMIVAPTYPMVRDVTLRTFRDLCGNRIVDFHKGELKATLYGGSEVLFRSGDDPEKLRGPNLSWLYVDEGAICDWMVWQIGLGRLRQYGQAGYAWLTTTPKGRNWVWKTFVSEPTPEHALYRAATMDNPYLDNDFVRDLQRDYVGKFAQQELEAEFVTHEGLVYEEFDREWHIYRGQLPAFHRVIAGIDWGYTNPAVILVAGIDGDGRMYLIDEFYRRQVRLAEHVQAAKALQTKWNIEVFICDPAEPANIAEMSMAGLYAIHANNAVMPGIQAVKARLAVQDDGRSRLYATPQTPNFIAEMESYAWKEKRVEGLVDQPEKVNDHAMDTARYMVLHEERYGSPEDWVIKPQ